MEDDDDKDSQARCTNQLHVTRPTRSQVRFSAGTLCDGGHGACQEDRKIPRGETASQVLVPLAAEWRSGCVLGR